MTSKLTRRDFAHHVSVAGGFTFNGENQDTDDRTGTEFHADAAIVQHFSKQFAVGVAAFHHRQITGDSGAGAGWATLRVE